MKDNGNPKTKSSAELRAMRDGRQSAPVSSRQQRLDSYREVIVRRQRDFVETGTALGLIAKDGLFKEAGFGSFEAMVTGEFDMSTSTAYRLVDAARVVTILSQVGTVESKIRNQTQALALAPLGKDREAMVLTIAAAEARGKLTAEVLADVRVELYPHTRVIDGEVVPEKPALVKGMRKAIERAAASVGTGVTYTPAQTSVTLCPVPRDLDNCQVCGVRLAERNAGYLRCPTCDPRQEHIAEATLDGQWAECRLCHPTSAAGPAANETAGSGDGPSPVAGPGLPQTAAEGMSPEADGVQAFREVPGHAFRSGDAPAPAGGSVPGPPSGVTQSSPAAGPFSAVRDEGPDRVTLRAEQQAQGAVGVALEEQERIEEEAVEGSDVDLSSFDAAYLDADDLLALDSPAAGATVPPPDEAYPPSSLPAQQPGPDSPTGVEGSRSETDEEFDEELRRINDGIVEAVAAAIDTEAGLAAITGHHTSAGVSDVGGAPARFGAVEQGLEDGGTAQDPSSSSDPDDEWISPFVVVRLMRKFAEDLDFIVDHEVMGPLITDAELAEMHTLTDRIALHVALIEKYRTP